MEHTATGLCCRCYYIGRKEKTVKKREPLLEIRREVGLKINTNKIDTSRHQNAGRIHNLMAANKCFEHVATSKCLVTIESNQNCILK
jgi:hypothetical protein